MLLGIKSGVTHWLKVYSNFKPRAMLWGPWPSGVSQLSPVNISSHRFLS